MPGREELPSTLKRSSAKAQRAWIRAHDAAVQEYGEGQRSHRTACSALKHSSEKVGDHWEAKPGGAKGPSDEQSARPRDTSDESYGGVDANASKEHPLKISRLAARRALSDSATSSRRASQCQRLVRASRYAAGSCASAALISSERPSGRSKLSSASSASPPPAASHALAASFSRQSPRTNTCRLAVLSARCSGQAVLRR